MEKESNGYLRMQVYPAMQMGGEPSQLYDQGKERAADIVLFAVSHHLGRFPSVEVFNLPFKTQSAQGSSRALWEYIQANNLERQELKGVRLLAVFVSTPKASDAAAVPDIYLLAMNSDAYKGLSDELKAVIKANSGAETSAWLGKTFDDGMGSPAPLAELEKSKQRAQLIIDDRIKELDGRGLIGKELVESARALILEYDPPK